MQVHFPVIRNKFFFAFHTVHGVLKEDEMAGWHHRLDGNEFEQAPGDGEGHGSLAC